MTAMLHVSFPWCLLTNNSCSRHLLDVLKSDLFHYNRISIRRASSTCSLTISLLSDRENEIQHRLLSQQIYTHQHTQWTSPRPDRNQQDFARYLARVDLILAELFSRGETTIIREIKDQLAEHRAVVQAVLGNLANEDQLEYEQLWKMVSDQPQAYYPPWNIDTISDLPGGEDRLAPC